MTYGIEVKNRFEQTVFGIKHQALKRVASGLATPAFYNSGTGQWSQGQLIFYPSGVSQANAVVFARPWIQTELNIQPTADSDFYRTEQRTFSTMNQKELEPFGVQAGAELQHYYAKKGYWPIGIEMVSGYFQFRSPDNSIYYYDGYYNKDISDSDRQYRRISEHWLENDYLPKNYVYYEIYIEGQSTSDETDSYGMKIVNSAGNISFNSNNQAFRTESSDPDHQMRVRFREFPAERLRYQTLGRKHFMESTSAYGQLEYMACMNGCASTVAWVMGGKVPHANDIVAPYEVPHGKTAYYHTYVEFHYFDQHDVFDRRPYIHYIPRLSYSRVNTTEEKYDSSIRYKEDMGVKTMTILGKSV